VFFTNKKIPQVISSKGRIDQSQLSGQRREKDQQQGNADILSLVNSSEFGMNHDVHAFG